MQSKSTSKGKFTYNKQSFRALIKTQNCNFCLQLSGANNFKLLQLQIHSSQPNTQSRFKFKLRSDVFYNSNVPKPRTESI